MAEQVASLRQMNELGAISDGEMQKVMRKLLRARGLLPQADDDSEE